ncbi:hypothetical protein ACHQM5_009545 [Ranunculus cassubicifolius]
MKTKKLPLSNSSKFSLFLLIFLVVFYLRFASTFYLEILEIFNNTSSKDSPPFSSPTSLQPPPLSPSPPFLPNSSLIDNDDIELFSRSLNVKATNFSIPKVAFLFLTNDNLPLAPLWEKFFKGHESFYSIYVHSHPLYKDASPKHSVFHGRRIPSKPVTWGSTSMIDAEKRLLANALLDFSNQRFVLLSDTCIPLYNFTTVYNYLINSKLSFLQLKDDPREDGRGRYNKKMLPSVSIVDWRTGSQWFELHRELAIVVVSDQTYYPIFREFCRDPCFQDEHYIPTLVNLVAPELNSNRSVTWVDWSKNTGAHPQRFVGSDITLEFMENIRVGSDCTYNEEASSICWLFARKFAPDTLELLMKIASVLMEY